MQIDLFTLVKPVAVLEAWVSSKMTLKLKIWCKLCKSFPRLPPNAKRANRARNLMTARTTSSLNNNLKFQKLKKLQPFNVQFPERDSKLPMIG